MFGHQDNSEDNNLSAEPVADNALSDDNASPVAPSLPAATPTAPVIDESMASDYIATDAPHADGDSTPPLQGNPQTDDLLNIKQQALQQLSPLVGHLDQSPEEKFRTTMMMIQGSDDQSLIPTAYEAAQAIPDEKAKAQALLDVVNEINYFTQHQTTEVKDPA
jgi:hypothetical protein